MNTIGMEMSFALVALALYVTEPKSGFRRLPFAEFSFSCLA
jgi:hypothetical protein